MNIFHLHKDPVICAEMHIDKHVVKMPIEYAQLMSTAHRVLDGELYLGKTKIIEILKDGDCQMNEKMFYTKLLTSITHLQYGFVSLSKTIYKCINSTKQH